MFSKTDIKDICALTPMQRGMLHQALVAPDARAYHEQLILRLDGAIDSAALERAWRQVLDRHDALRGRFLAERVSSPVQLIPHHEPLALAVHAIGAQPGAALPGAVEDYLAHDRALGFDLANAHPMRLALFSAGAARHWLVWSFHHILLDGWSIGVVLDEVRALCAGQPLAAAPSWTSYLRWCAARDQDAARAFWRGALAGCDAEPLAPDAGAGHAAAHAAVDAASAARLRALAQEQHASMHHLLLSAWALVTGRQLDRRDVIVPTVLAGRPQDLDDAERLVGLLINTVPMRVQWDDAEPFTELLRRVREHSLEAAAHQHLSLAEIQSARGALALDHVLLVQAMPGQDVVGQPCGGATIGWAEFREQVPYALEVSLTPHGGGIGVALRGSAPQAWLQRLADQLRMLLEALAADPRRSAGSFDLLAPAEHARVLAWGDGGAAPEPATVLQLFDARLAQAPDAPAVVAADGTLSYRELDRRANRLAHALRAAAPLAPDCTVALLAHRDSALLVGLLAILRAGAAYVPIDPDYPAERVRLMLEASGARLALAAPDLAAALAPAMPRVSLEAWRDPGPDTPPAAAPAPAQLAYVIFTSGSTGAPKGAMLSHRNAAACFAALPRVFGFQPGERMLGVTTVSFDIAALELLGALSCGMTVVLATAADARDPARLASLIEHERVEVMQLTPTRLKLLLDGLPAAASRDGGAALAGVRTVLVGGEALPPALAAQLLGWRGKRVFNVYGPTETTIWSSSWQLAPGPVRLGRALPGERLLVLSSARALQPPGALGEIAIAGAGVARGYLNDPERSAERFIRLPGIDGPVYLTGDLGRWTEDGELEYRGRRDDQVKLRGMRIELGEIEQHLRALPGVRDAACAVRDDAAGAPQLLAYLVGAPADAAALRAALGARLPAALVPSQFVYLDALPQTPNGKTDRRALPAPAPRAHAPARRPASALEQSITDTFAQVLGHPVGPDDDFFLSGGHSLKAIQAVGRLNRELGGGYTLRALYRNPSAAALAAAAASAQAPLERAPQAADYPLSHAQQALWVLQQMEPDYAGYNVPGTYLLEGQLDAAALARAWEALVARHESLRTVFRLAGGAPRQLVLERTEVTIERHPPPASPQALEALIAALTCRPFDLAHGPLFRLALIELAPQRHVLLLVLHHIASDGWSDALMAEQLGQAYSAARAGRTPETGAGPALRYRDFAVWQRHYLATPAARAHRDYWAALLRDLPLLAWPDAAPRSARLARRGARIAFRLEQAEADAWLAAVAPGQRYATLAAAVLALLHVETGQSDLVLGLPVANRDRAELQDQVGLHLNMLPLRQQLPAQLGLERVRAACASAIVEALAHADYPFAALVDELGIAAAPGRHPVFDAILIYHQHPTPVPALDGLAVAPWPMQSYTSRFDLDVEVWTDDGVHGFIEYDADLFTPARAAAIASRWRALLRASGEEPGVALSELARRLGPVREDSASFLARSLALDEEF